jgi:hypothetical protein
VRELRELAAQEIRDGAHFFCNVGANDAGGRALARNAHRAHRHRHEQRQDHDCHEQFDEREATTGTVPGQLSLALVHDPMPPGV